MSRSCCHSSKSLCAVLHALPAALLSALSNASPRGQSRFKRLYCVRPRDGPAGSRICIFPRFARVSRGLIGGGGGMPGRTRAVPAGVWLGVSIILTYANAAKMRCAAGRAATQAAFAPVPCGRVCGRASGLHRHRDRVGRAPGRSSTRPGGQLRLRTADMEDTGGLVQGERVVICGAGNVGAALAYTLSARGCSPLVILNAGDFASFAVVTFPCRCTLARTCEMNVWCAVNCIDP